MIIVAGPRLIALFAQHVLCVRLILMRCHHFWNAANAHLVIVSTVAVALAYFPDEALGNLDARNRLSPSLFRNKQDCFGGYAPESRGGM